jgi:hypothetical protein
MAQGPFWEAVKIFHPSYVTYFAHKNPLLDHILRQINPVHALTQYLFLVHFNIIFPSMLCIGLSSGLFSSEFQTKNFDHISHSPMPHLYKSCSFHPPYFD